MRTGKEILLAAGALAMLTILAVGLHSLAQAFPPAAAAGLAEAAPEDGASTSVSASERVGARREAVRPVPAAAAGVRVSGRCLCELTGQPLPDCSVVLETRIQPGAAEYNQIVSVLEKLAEEVTGRAGEFEFTHPTVDHQSDMVVTASAPGYVPVQATFACEPSEPVAVDLGDLFLASAGEIKGLVNDAAGSGLGHMHVTVAPFRPVAGFASLAGAPAPRLVRRDVLGATTDASGSFIMAPLTPGEWTVRVSLGRAFSAEQTVQVEPARSTFVSLTVGDLQPDNYMTGRVIDAEGVPVERAWVRALEDGAAVATDTTDPEGRFFLAAPGSRKAVRLQVRDEQGVSDCQDHLTSESYSWGGRDLVLVVSRRPGIELKVMDAATGDPVEQYGVRVFRDPDEGHADMRLKQVGIHAGGRCLIRGVPAGRVYCQVVPRDPRFKPTQPRPLQVEAWGTPPQTVVLDRYVVTEVCVVTEAGQPVSGSLVELVAELSGKAINVRTTVTPWAVMMLGDRSGLSAGQREKLVAAALLDSRRTDAQGRARLSHSPTPGLQVRVTGARHCPQVVAAPEAGGVLALVVARGAVVRGQLEPPEAVARLLSHATHLGEVRLVPRDNQQLMAVAKIDREGRFEAGGLAAGEWSVHLVTPYGSRRLEPVRIGDAGRETVLHVKLTDADIPGILVGQVMRSPDDTNQRHRWHVLAWSERGRAAAVSDESGAFRLQLLPGDYRFRVSDGSMTGNGPHYHLATTARVAAGQTTNLLLEVERTRVQLRFVTADGAAVTKGLRMVVDVERRSGVYTERSTDERGTVVLDPAPCGPFHVIVRRAAGEALLGPFAATPGVGGVVEVVVPE